MSLLVIDIAAVPNVEMGAKLYGLHDLSKKDITRVMYTKSREKENNPGVLEPHMQKVLAISVLYQDQESTKCMLLGDESSNEQDLLQQLQQLLAINQPGLITWDGLQSVLPILNYRYFSHGLQTPLQEDLNHADIKHELTGTHHQAELSLYEAAVLAGYPGNQQMTQDVIIDAWLDDDIETVHHDKRLNVLTIWLLYLRLQHTRGELDASLIADEQLKLQKMLAMPESHYLAQSLEGWNIAAADDVD